MKTNYFCILVMVAVIVMASVTLFLLVKYPTQTISTIAFVYLLTFMAMKNAPIAEK